MDQDLAKWRRCLNGLAAVNARIVARFASVDDAEERSKLINHAILRSYLDGVEKCPSESKNVLKSKEFREFGNEVFNSDPSKLLKALKFYSKSILYAPPGTNELSFGYANRSAVLLKGEYYVECLEDIDRALKNGYPDDLKTKLLLRKLTCSYASTSNVNLEKDEILKEAQSLIDKLPVTHKMRKFVEDFFENLEKINQTKEQSRKIPQKYIPEVKGRNPQLPGASDAVALKYSKKYGRHLVATRDIKSGEILLLEEPYAKIVVGEIIDHICTHCTKMTWNSVPCDTCVYAMFCSEKCKQAAWSDYHDIECQVLGEIVGAGYMALLSLRMTVKAIKEAGSLENLKIRLKELDTLKECNVDSPINPNSYETIYTMNNNHAHENPGEAVYHAAISTRTAYHLATRTEVLGMKFPRNSDIVAESEWFPFITDLIAKNMRIAKFRSNEAFKNGDGVKGDSIVTLIPIYSFLNHRCYDGVVFLPFDGKASVITPVPIKKGEQIFTNYGQSYTAVSKQSRQESYQAKYHFNCDCLACAENWPTSTPPSWEKQNLPQEIAEQLRDGIQSFRMFDFDRIQNREVIVSIFTRICELMDLLHPRVRKPCLEIEMLSDLIVNLHHYLSSPHSKFGEECRCSCDGPESCPQDYYMKKTLPLLLSCI